LDRCVSDFDTDTIAREEEDFKIHLETLWPRMKTNQIRVYSWQSISVSGCAGRVGLGYYFFRQGGNLFVS
jgi:hypothetical protein